jgi:hypothetical protein
MTEYVLSTLVKVTIREYEADKWPKTFSECGLFVNLPVLEFNKGLRSCLLRRDNMRMIVVDH